MATSVVEWISSAGTAGAALAATYAARKASQSAAASVDLVRIERERLDDERRQSEVAELRAEPELISWKSRKLMVTNEGLAAAKDVLLVAKAPGAPTQATESDRLAPQERIMVETARGGGPMSLCPSWLISRSHGRTAAARTSEGSPRADERLGRR